jgi:hypothetical protein
MSRLKFKQILSNLQYNVSSSQLTLSGSNTTRPDFVISGSVIVTSTINTTGSLTIQNIDSFGDSGSFFTVDLGSF